MAGPHILVVGGTGMLSGFCEARASDGARLSLVSRRASAWRRAPADAFDCDYNDEAAFVRAVDAAVGRNGPVDVAVAWFHSVRAPACRRLAERVGAPGSPGRYIQVLGSAVGDPARRDRLALAAEVAAGLPHCVLRQVVLGFVLTCGGARWLTNAEISDGVTQAVETDAPLSIVGAVEPWSARP